VETLKHCLKTVTDQPQDDIEILVSDNASDDETEAVVRSNPDRRIRYLNTGRRLPMTANWEFALSHAHGQWIGFLGDDDGLLPGGIARMLETARSTDTRLVRCRPCDYLWPSVNRSTNGRLVVPTSRKITVEHGTEALGKLMSGQWQYTRLPTAYTGGFAHRDLVNAARAPDGRFFHSQIPDIFSAIRFAASGARFAFSELPFAINGLSSKSTGLSQFSRSSPNAPAKQFQGEGNMPLHPSIPPQADGSVPPAIHALVMECYRQVGELDPALPALDAAEQLAIIIRLSGETGPAMQAWVRLYMQANGLAEAPPVPLARIHALVDKWQARLRLDRMMIAGPGAPSIRNVHEAAFVAAAELSAEPPSMAAIAFGHLRFAVGRLAARLG
jgi:hypothetical protein